MSPRLNPSQAVLLAKSPVASVMGVLVGLGLASRFFWHLPCFLLSSLSLVACPLIYRVMPAMQGHRTGLALPFGEQAAVAGLVY